MALAALPHPSIFAFSERQDKMEKKSCHFSENSVMDLVVMVVEILPVQVLGWRMLAVTPWVLIRLVNSPSQDGLGLSSTFQTICSLVCLKCTSVQKAFSLVPDQVAHARDAVHLVLPSHCLIEIGAEKSNLLVFKGPFKYVNTTE